MNILSSWNQFWFRKGSYFDLAVVRLLAVGLQLYMLAFMSEDLTYHIGLPDEMFESLLVLKILTGGIRPTAEVVNIIYLITLVAGCLSFVGWRTNSSLFVFALGNVFLQAYSYSFGDMHHRDAIMMIALFVFSLSPCRRRLSVDSLLGKSYNPLVDASDAIDNQDGSTFAYWPLLFLQVFFVLMYLSAFTSKIASSGLGWINGYTLQYYLIRDGFRWAEFGLPGGSEFALWVSQFHYLIMFAQLVVVIFQATFWVVLFFPKTKWVYIPLGLFFHCMIYYTLKAPFIQWIVLYSVFIPWSLVFEWLSLKLNARPNVTENSGS